MRGIDVEVLLGAGYAIFLALVAAALNSSRGIRISERESPHCWILLPRRPGCLEMPQRQTALSDRGKSESTL